MGLADVGSGSEERLGFEMAVSRHPDLLETSAKKFTRKNSVLNITS